MGVMFSYADLVGLSQGGRVYLQTFFGLWSLVLAKGREHTMSPVKSLYISYQWEAWLKLAQALFMATKGAIKA